jgi:hypothetical protein
MYDSWTWMFTPQIPGSALGGYVAKKNDATLRILPALIFQQTDIFSATDMKQQTWDCITASHNYDCEAGKGHTLGDFLLR